MKKILLIEDNAEIRENTEEILELAGYEVVTAENGEKGMELALTERPDLVLCDILMPGTDGFTVLDKLQKGGNMRGTSFIFLTAQAEKCDLERGLQMGADKYITKPFSGADLLNLIEACFKGDVLNK